MATAAQLAQISAYQRNKQTLDQTRAQEISDYTANLSIQDANGNFLNPVNMYKNPDGGPSIGAITDDGWNELGKIENGKFVHQDKLLGLLNTSATATSYTDINTGKTEKGKIVGLNVDPEDGKISLSIQGKQGIVPKTLGFSNDPNDVVLFTNAADMKDQLNTILLGQQAKRSKGAATLGAATQQGIADAEDKNASETIAGIEADVESGKISPKEGAEQLEAIREFIKNGIANLEEEKTDPGETPKEAVNRDGTIEQRLPGTRNLAMQDDVSGANQDQGTPRNVQELIEMDTYTSNQIDKALRTSGRSADLINARKVFNDELLVQLGYLTQEDYDAIDTTDKNLPVGQQAIKKAQRLNLRKQALNDYQDAKKETDKTKSLAAASISKEAEEKYNIPQPDFTDIEGLKKYAADNEASLQLLGTDGQVLTKIQEVLNKYDVKEEKDLAKIPQTEFGPRFGMLEIAAGIAAAASGQAGFNTTFTNMVDIFGGSGATNLEVAEFAQDNAQFMINQTRLSNEFLTKLQATNNQDAIKAGTALIDDNKTFIESLYKNKKNENTTTIQNPFRSGESIASFKSLLAKFKNTGGTNGGNVKFSSDGKVDLSSVNPQAYELIKTTMGQALFAYASNAGDKKFLDWFRSSAGASLADQLDRVKYTTEVRNGKRYIKSVDFYDTTGKRTDTRISGSKLSQLFGAPGSEERGLLMDFLNEDKG